MVATASDELADVSVVDMKSCEDSRDVPFALHCDAKMDDKVLDYEKPNSTYPTEDAQRAAASVHVWTVTAWLLVINISVYLYNNWYGQRYLVDSRTNAVVSIWRPLDANFAFNVPDGVKRLQLWRFVTFQFLHGNFEHIVFNMFTLYMFGGLLEQYLGRRRFLAFYLICGVGGAVLYMIMSSLGFFGASVQDVAKPLVGASAGIFGLLIAMARIAPNETILLWGSIPVRLKTFAYVMLGLAVVTIFSRGFNAGGEAAHLGGAVVGYFLIARPEWLNFFEVGITKRPRIYQR